MQHHSNYNLGLCERRIEYCLLEVIRAWSFSPLLASGVIREEFANDFQVTILHDWFTVLNLLNWLLLAALTLYNGSVTKPVWWKSGNQHAYDLLPTTAYSLNMSDLPEWFILFWKCFTYSKLECRTRYREFSDVHVRSTAIVDLDTITTKCW